jgi:ABC-2 type transport system permease protein
MISKYGPLLKNNLRITSHMALIYRANTIFFLLFETVFFVANFYTVHLGFELAGGTLNGWTKHEGFLVGSIFNFTHQIFLCFFSACIFDFGEKSGNGTLDFILLKPHHPLISMWVSCDWLMTNVPCLLLSGCVMVYFMLTSDSVSISFMSTLLCVGFIILGAIFRVALGLLCVSPVFFSEKLHAVDTYWSVAGVGIYPRDVLPKLMQYMFTFGVPVFLVSSVPAEAFFGKHSWSYFLVCFAVGLTFSYLCFRIFNWSLKHYKSVNAGV